MGPLTKRHRWVSSYQNLWWQRTNYGAPYLIIRGGLALEFKVRSPTGHQPSPPLLAAQPQLGGGGTGGSMRESLTQQMFPEHT